MHWRLLPHLELLCLVGSNQREREDWTDPELDPELDPAHYRRRSFVQFPSAALR